MARYYLGPEPDRVPEAFKTLKDAGMFASPERAWGYVSFFTEVMARSATRIAAWTDEVGTLADPAKSYWWTAVWTGGTVEGQQLIEMGKREAIVSPRHLDYKWLDTQPPNILARPIRGPDQVKMLWHAFLATGEKRYVLKLVEGLPPVPALDPSETDVVARHRHAQQSAIRPAARETLIAGLRDHPRVREALEEALAKLQPKHRPEVQSILDAVPRGATAP